ncbi:hypothetical protein Bca52824_094960 [Brassica carinata]|uniref:Protein kinase domain-containing protein n=1 Tax=Brassica carinata TaxID=52824 RepID=A0A8X7TJA7_BRACI|nr:hypothetical protein Bca52824_094960 [Brassica carinata]
MAEHNKIEMVDQSEIIENKAIPMQILKDATNNFGVENLLGEGGFGSVYRGTLQYGREIAVKKINQSTIAGKGLKEFKSEVTVLTRVHHRNLVSLYGYSIEGNNRLLVYQYMPQEPKLHPQGLETAKHSSRDDLRAKASDIGLVTATEEDMESVKTKCHHSRAEDDIHITTWFRKMLREDATFLESIDGNIIANQETQRTIYEVAKLA